MHTLTPEIFELAYSYRDIGNEVDHIEYNWQKDSNSENMAVLDVRCNSGNHLEQFASRGYECTGMESNKDLLSHCQSKCKQDGYDFDLIRSDMRSFRLDKKFGLAINMLGYANFLLTNSDMVEHLRSVARALEVGGIYYLEMVHPREYTSNTPRSARSWELSRNDLQVTTEISHDNLVDPVTQTQNFTTTVTVQNKLGEKVYQREDLTRIYLYQEFLSLLENAGGFELINCYGTFNSAVDFNDSRRSWRMLPVLRRTDEEV